MFTDAVMAEMIDRKNESWRLHHYRGAAPLIYRIADTSFITLALWLSCLITHVEVTPSLIMAGAIGLTLFHVLAEMKDLYRPWRTESIRAELWPMIESWLGVSGVSVIAVYAQLDIVDYPPSVMLYWFLMTPIMLGIWRMFVRHALRWGRARGFNSRRLAIAGSGELAQQVARTIEDNPWMGLKTLGFFDDPRDAASTAPAAHTLDSLSHLARNGGVDVVYLALGPGQEGIESSTALLHSLSDSTVSVYLVQDRRSRADDRDRVSRQIVPDLARLDLLHRRYVDLGGIKAVSLYESPFAGLDALIKRVEDISIASIALILLAIPMGIIAIGVKLSGPGPVFFKQRRYGLDGREISVWKFRSMCVCEDGEQVAQARKGDMRVTPFGAFIRRTSLDELPQFFNVLQGSMSIVGPRPHAVAHNEHYRNLIRGYMLRHKVKPGITGWAQINGWRGETDSVDKMGHRIDFDLDYIRNWSLWLDIWIILLTFAKGFVHKNAY